MSATKEHYHDEIEKGMRVKEHPVLFSPPMVQAILEGRKTQTRRVVKKIHPNSKNLLPESEMLNHSIGFTFWEPDQFEVPENERLVSLVKCPYGKPGHLLWVRETFDSKSGCLGSVLFKANYSTKELNQAAKGVFRWKPSIHMKKDYARIWLEVEEIKVERLKDISHDDCPEEGIEMIGTKFKNYLGNEPTYNQRISFRSLWQSINGLESWEQNPWVWVVKFKVISTTGKPVLTT